MLLGFKVEEMNLLGNKIICFTLGRNFIFDQPICPSMIKGEMVMFLMHSYEDVLLAQCRIYLCQAMGQPPPVLKTKLALHTSLMAWVLAYLRIPMGSMCKVQLVGVQAAKLGSCTILLHFECSVKSVPFSSFFLFLSFFFPSHYFGPH